MGRTVDAVSGEMSAESRQAEPNGLPQGWIRAALGEVCVINPKHQKGVVTDSDLVSFVPMADVDHITGTICGKQTRPYGQVRKGFTHFADGDVLFARITPCMENGKVAVARGLANGLGCGTTEFLVLRPLAGTLPEYVYHYLRQESLRRAAAANMSGTAGQLRVPTEYIKSVELPLPPLPEQRRIEAKIEALFEESRTAREALDRIPPLLKKFRQAVLAAAFRGDLTWDWREQNLNVEPASSLLARIVTQGHRKTIEAPRAANAKSPGRSPARVQGLPELPRGWEWCTLEQCTNLITKGESPKWQGFQYEPEGVPFVRSENVLWGMLELAGVARVPEGFHHKLARSALRPNDVLINLVGASIGRCAIVPPELHEGNVNQAVAVIRTTDALSPIYLLYLLLSPRMQAVIQGKKVEVARPNISLGDLRGLLIPLAPRLEQQGIATVVNSLFARAAAIEVAVEMASRRTDTLGQSILARAFRGELVPQDPQDEPASVLLRRVQSQAGENSPLRRSPPPSQRRGKPAIPNLPN